MCIPTEIPIDFCASFVTNKRMRMSVEARKQATVVCIAIGLVTATIGAATGIPQVSALACLIAAAGWVFLPPDEPGDDLYA